MFQKLKYAAFCPNNTTARNVWATLSKLINISIASSHCPFTICINLFHYSQHHARFQKRVTRCTISSKSDQFLPNYNALKEYTATFSPSESLPIAVITAKITGEKISTAPSSNFFSIAYFG